MQKAVEEYLEKVRQQEQTEREKFLLNHNICEKVYTKNPTQPSDCPYYDPKIQSFYKKVPIEVSDEEWDAIVSANRLVKSIPTAESYYKDNGIAKILRIFAILTYLGGFICGIALGKDSWGDFSFFLCLLYWLAGFVSGTFVLGFASVLSLLQEIKNNLQGK